jgi:hypothetical protein
MVNLYLWLICIHGWFVYMVDVSCLWLTPGWWNQSLPGFCSYYSYSEAKYSDCSSLILCRSNWAQVCEKWTLPGFQNYSFSCGYFFCHFSTFPRKNAKKKCQVSVKNRNSRNSGPSELVNFGAGELRHSRPSELGNIGTQDHQNSRPSKLKTIRTPDHLNWWNKFAHRGVPLQSSTTLSWSQQFCVQPSNLHLLCPQHLTGSSAREVSRGHLPVCVWCIPRFVFRTARSCKVSSKSGSQPRCKLNLATEGVIRKLSAISTLIHAAQA